MPYTVPTDRNEWLAEWLIHRQGRVIVATHGPTGAKARLVLPDAFHVHYADWLLIELGAAIDAYLDEEKG